MQAHSSADFESGGNLFSVRLFATKDAAEIG